MTDPSLSGGDARPWQVRIAAVATVMLLAACGTGTAPTAAGPTAAATAAGSAPIVTTAVAPPSTAAPATPAPTASTAAATPVPTSTASPAPTPSPTLGGDIDLESLMPTEIAGTAMTLEPASDSAQSFLILWNDEKVAKDLLAMLGRSEKDISVVFTYATNAKFPDRVAVNAYRVAGADGVALRDGMVDNYVKFFESAGADATVTPTQLGGKATVLLSIKGAPAASGEYWYAYRDIAFNVNGNPPAWVEDAFSKLP